MLSFEFLCGFSNNKLSWHNKIEIMVMTIDEYMADVPLERRERMEELIGSIRSWFPGARISMKRGMPTFEAGENWVAVANHEDCVSLHTCSREHITSYIEKHPEITHGKDCINFGDEDEIDIDDVREVVMSVLTPENFRY